MNAPARNCAFAAPIMIPLHGRLLAAFSRRSLALLILSFVAGMSIYSRTAVGPLQEAIRAQLGLTDNQMALVQGPALVLPALLLGVPVGLLVDHGSRVRLIAGLAVISVVGSVLTALASGFASLFLGRTLVGLGSYAIPITAISLIADLFPPSARGRANMALAIGEIAGMAAAFEVGGAALQAVGAGSSGWRTAMWWLSIPVLLAPVACVGLIEPARAELGTVSRSIAAPLAGLWRYRKIVGPLLVGLGTVGVADGAALIWVAPTLSRRFHLAPADIGTTIAACMFFGGTIGPVLGGSLADICQRSGGPRRTLFALRFLALVSTVSGAFALMPGIWSLDALLAGFLTVGGAINVAVMTTLSVSLPNELRGSALAASVTASLVLGLGLAPLAVSLLSGALGGPPMIGRALGIVCVATSAAAAAAFSL